MKSHWIEFKEAAIELRMRGQSLKAIHHNLGVPLSTLSGWLRNIKIAEEHTVRLQKNKKEAWERAHVKAAEWHRTQKALRIVEAKKEAATTLGQLDLSDTALLDLAFAMLYFGEGAKSGTTSIANSDPTILRFVLAVLRRNYGIKPQQVRCELHLRADQKPEELKVYWSQQLGIPVERFRYVTIDKRSAGKPTYDHYHGVCVITCGTVAIRRKLMYLYSLFCEKITEL